MYKSVGNKGYLIQVLKKLKGHRALADGILALIEEVELGDNMIDGILKIIQDAIKEQTEEKDKQKLIGAGKILQRIRDREQRERPEDLDRELDQMLNDM